MNLRQDDHSPWERHNKLAQQSFIFYSHVRQTRQQGRALLPGNVPGRDDLPELETVRFSDRLISCYWQYVPHEWKNRLGVIYP